MTVKFNTAKKIYDDNSFYTTFDVLDGSHPWMQAVEEGYVGYHVRELKTGNVAYFNFILAKEMGLISENHPNELNEELEQKLIQTFSLQIINEFDELTKRKIDSSTIRPNKYMATRYLQLQHANKQGKTSGDGRGIWNGTVTHKGMTWDVSSRGTGVTCLAPGSVQANRPLKTGGTEFGYGCGLAEIDELISASILAEIIHLQGIKTERVLCVIDLGKGYGIGIRAAPNLLRPAHLFLYLKQDRYDDLKKATDYLIQRQLANKSWKIPGNGQQKYDQMLEQISKNFAEFTAKMEMDYIFAWLDWDGDNVLADAGIIDYGSVRQFGIRHDQYRYDDVERFSTTLNEQKAKARLTVQVFAQLVDYLKTGKKKPLKNFANHPQVIGFNIYFEGHRADRILYRMGFTSKQRELIRSKKGLFEKFDKEFTFFETRKVSGKTAKVADGINHPALYNMRTLLRELPRFLVERNGIFDSRHMSHSQFFNIAISGFANSKDAKIKETHRKRMDKFQVAYRELIKVASAYQKTDSVLPGIAKRSSKLNSDKRITGNALIEIVDEIITEKKRGLPLQQIQKIIDRLIFEFVDMPEVESGRHYRENVTTPAVKMDLFIRLQILISDHKESI